MAKTKFWNFKNSTDTVGELTIYGTISEDSWWGDEITPKQFADDLKALGNVAEINVHLNSGGGDVFAGQAIYAMLKSHSASINVYIDGIAASIASIIAMAGDKIIMHPGAMMMIHNPWSSIWGGDAADMRKTADTLDKIKDALIAVYKVRTGKTEDELKTLMDDETWMTAEEAVTMGFADEVTGIQAAASINGNHLIMNGVNFDLTQFRNKAKLLNNIKGGQGAMNFEEIMNTLSEEQRKVVQAKITGDVNAAVQKVTDDKDKAIQDLTKERDDLKNAQTTTTNPEDAILAAATPEVKALLEAARKDAREAQAAAQALRDEKELANYKAELTEYNKLPVNAEKLAPAFRNFAKADAEGYKELQAILKAANKIADDSKIFADAGTGAAGTGTDGTALEQLNAKAATIAKASNISIEKAFVQACRDNKELYSQYCEELDKKEE